MFFNSIEKNPNNSINKPQTEIQNNQNNNFNNNMLNSSMNYYNSYNNYKNDILNSSMNNNILNESVKYSNKENNIFNSNLSNINKEIIIENLKNLIDQSMYNEKIKLDENEKNEIIEYIIKRYGFDTKKFNIFEEEIIAKVKEVKKEIRKKIWGKMWEKIEKNEEKLKEILNGGKFVYDEDGYPNISKGINDFKHIFKKNLKELTDEYKKNNYKNISDILKKSEDSLKTLKNKNVELLNFDQNIDLEDRKNIFGKYLLDIAKKNLEEEIDNIKELKNNVLEIKDKTLKNISKYPKENTRKLKRELEENTEKIIKIFNNTILDFKKVLASLNNFTPKKIYRIALIKPNNEIIKLEEKILEYIKSNILNLENELKTTNAKYGNDLKSMQDLLNEEIESETYEKKKIEKIGEKMKKLWGYARYFDYINNINYPMNKTFFRKISTIDSKGMEGATEELNLSLKYLIDIYANKPIDEVSQMLEITPKYYIKLKNKTGKFMKLAKKINYEEGIFDIEKLKEYVNKEGLDSTIKLKKQINELKNKILEKIKNSSNKKKAKEFKENLENLTTLLMNNLDEATLKLYITILKSKNISDKNEKFHKLIRANYTIIDVYKKIINYLKSIFEDYKNLI